MSAYAPYRPAWSESVRGRFIRALTPPWDRRPWRGARAGKQQSNRPRSLLQRQRQIGTGLATGRGSGWLLRVFPRMQEVLQIARPAQTIHRASRRTMRMTSVPAAPSAMRTPISCVRHTTVYASRPYSPMTASSAPRAPNPAESVANNRCGTMVESICSFIPIIRTMGTVFNTTATVWRTVLATPAGSILVRIAS